MKYEILTHLLNEHNTWPSVNLDVKTLLAMHIYWKKKKRANKTGMKSNTQEQSSHTRKQEK